MAKILICNNCKKFYIAPIEKCECGCKTLTETHPDNIIFTDDFLNACDIYFGRKKETKQKEK